MSDALAGVESVVERLYVKGDFMTEWKNYRRLGTAEMRPVDPAESLDGISVSEPDKHLHSRDPDEFNRGFVARNPKNHDDQWYVSRAYFDENFEEVGADKG